MTVGRLCCREVTIAHSEESAATAAARMREADVGCLVVIDADREPVGLLTDRDLVVRVMGLGSDPAQVEVGDVMSPAPKVISEEASIDDGIALMRRAGVRRLPVVDAVGGLAGLLTLDDVLDLLTEELGDIRRLLTVQGPWAPDQPEVID